MLVSDMVIQPINEQLEIKKTANRSLWNGTRKENQRDFWDGESGVSEG